MHKFVKCIIMNSLDNNYDVNVDLLQMRSIAVRSELPSPAILLFNGPIRPLLPKMNREPTTFNSESEHYEALRTCQDKYVKGSDTC